MEKFGVIKRLPKRMALCLYLTCTMLGASALFTLYLDVYESSAPTVQGSVVTSELDVGANGLSGEDSKSASSNSGRKISGDIVPPGLTRAPNSASLPQNVSDAGGKSAAVRRTKYPGVQLHRRKISGDITKYVFLDTVSTTRTPTPSNRSNYGIVTKRTLPVPAPDSCLSSDSKDSKLILLWTSFFGYSDYLPMERFARCRQCRNCRVTTDRMKLRESDAVIFHARDMSVSDLPPLRYPHQKWVFYCMESPPYSDFPGLLHMRSMFNWTMTYRSDSDVISQYGSLTKIRPPQKIDLQALQWTFSNKSKSVVWMSSHCPTNGGRDAYVKELRKYIDVDVYGECGTSVCSRDQTSKCLKDFSDKYRFFLAFENTVCKDYITEKFFRALNYDIIPVVFGGAEYDKFAPPASFIDALSFKSPKHLAFFLAGVGENFKMYSSYFRWRMNYSVHLSNQKECELCSLLHRTDIKPSSYANLRNWWVDGSQCRTWKPK